MRDMSDAMPPTITDSGFYKHEALEQDYDQIRLIRLHRDYHPTPPTTYETSSSKGLHCRIVTFPLGMTPPYIALSYTWGAIFPTRTIRVNCKNFVIRENLFTFLNIFCEDEQNEYWLWIDQLCIDQSSTKERNHQVRLMAQIYWSCVYVVAWLDVSSAIAAKDFSEKATAERANILLRNRYFTRLWIVQEVILPPEVRLLCGNVWVEWRKLADVVSRSGSHNNRTLTAASWLLYHSNRSRFTEDILWHSLDWYGTMECQDPRDKVYGLLGLVQEEQRPEIDYNKPLEEVFLDVVAIPTSWSSVIEFARNIGFTEAHISQLEFLFQDMRNLGYKRSAPKMGFEKADPKGRHPDRWWYEHEGLRYYCDCLPSYKPEVKAKPLPFSLLAIRYR
jgi:hypothetical protein